MKRRPGIGQLRKKAGTPLPKNGFWIWNRFDPFCIFSGYHRINNVALPAISRVSNICVGEYATTKFYFMVIFSTALPSLQNGCPNKYG
jgi:hypothetical protein